MSGNGELLLIISPEADADTDEIAFYLALQNEELSLRFLAAVKETIEFLLENPNAGRQRDRPSINRLPIRQWPVRGFSNYLVFYRPLDNGVRILRVLHGAQNLTESVG